MEYGLPGFTFFWLIGPSLIIVLLSLYNMIKEIRGEDE